MALNAEAIWIVREIESMINIESANTETLKALLLVDVLQLGNDEEESLGLYSLSSSDEESMTDSDDMTPENSSYSSMSSYMFSK